MIKNFTFVYARAASCRPHCAAFIIEKNSALISPTEHVVEYKNTKTLKKAAFWLAQFAGGRVAIPKIVMLIFPGRFVYAIATKEQSRGGQVNRFNANTVR